MLAVPGGKMKPPKWMPSFELGVKEIDDEHRDLFDCVLRIHATAEQEDLAQCAAFTEKFLAAARRHFEKEEAFLAQVGYPDTVEHKAFHERLMPQIHELKKACDVEADMADIWRCYSGVLTILMDDIIRGDTKFKSYLHEHGYS